MGSAYSFRLEASDPNATYSLWYNPGENNDFEETGLKMDKQGLISGTPLEAGSYTFSVCAANADGEDYREFTLTVAEAPAVAPTTQEATSPTTPDSTSDTTLDNTSDNSPENTAPASQPQEQPSTAPEDRAGSPWWIYLLIALGGIGIGVASVFILMKKKA